MELWECFERNRLLTKIIMVQSDLMEAEDNSGIVRDVGFKASIAGSAFSFRGNTVILTESGIRNASVFFHPFSSGIWRVEGYFANETSGRGFATFSFVYLFFPVK